MKLVGHLHFQGFTSELRCWLENISSEWNIYNNMIIQLMQFFANVSMWIWLPESEFVYKTVTNINFFLNLMNR